jgi:hypothetical protein
MVMMILDSTNEMSLSTIPTSEGEVYGTFSLWEKGRFRPKIKDIIFNQFIYKEYNDNFPSSETFCITKVRVRMSHNNGLSLTGINTISPFYDEYKNMFFNYVYIKYKIPLFSGWGENHAEKGMEAFLIDWKPPMYMMLDSLI